MEKLIIATVIAGLWLIGCSKESATEPTDKPPVDTTTTDTVPTEFEYNIKCSDLFLDGSARYLYLYVPPKTPINTQWNVKCDSIKILQWKDSINYSLLYYYFGGGTGTSENNGNIHGSKIKWFNRL